MKIIIPRFFVLSVEEDEVFWRYWDDTATEGRFILESVAERIKMIKRRKRWTLSHVPLIVGRAKFKAVRE